MSVSRLRHPVVLAGVALITAHVALFALHRKVTEVGRYQRAHHILTGQRSDQAPPYNLESANYAMLCETAVTPSASASMNTANATPTSTRTSQLQGKDGLVIDYYEAASDVYKDGDSIQLDVSPGSTLALNGKTYQLVRIDLRTLGEGKTGEMVARLIHKADAGKRLVLSVLLRPGKANSTLARLLKFLPVKSGEHNALWDVRINPTAFLPANLDYYIDSRARSDLPCKNVRSLVLEQPAELSPVQLAAYGRALGLKVSSVPEAGNDVVADQHQG